MKDLNEGQIIRLLSQQKEEGLRLAYRAYGSIIYGMLLKMLKNKALAQEVLKEVFVNACRNSKLYKPKKQQGFTCLANMARTAAIDKLRRLKQRKGAPDSPLEMLQQSLDDCLEEETLLENRDLIELVYFHGYTLEKIAKKSNFSVELIRVQLREAFMHLRRSSVK